MKKLSKESIINSLKKKGFNPKKSWFYIQFKDKFEEEYNIYQISFSLAYKNLIDFLEKEKISEVLFFPEPEFKAKEWGQKEIPNALVKTEELKEFLEKHVNTFTNCHVADKKLKWIFTITHEDDFFISGSKDLTKKFIKFFKRANIMSREEIKAKWN